MILGEEVRGGRPECGGRHLFKIAIGACGYAGVQCAGVRVVELFCFAIRLAFNLHVPFSAPQADFTSARTNRFDCGGIRFCVARKVRYARAIFLLNRNREWASLKRINSYERENLCHIKAGLP